jgi:hypothetical protein
MKMLEGGESCMQHPVKTEPHSKTRNGEISIRELRTRSDLVLGTPFNRALH